MLHLEYTVNRYWWKNKMTFHFRKMNKRIKKYNASKSRKQIYRDNLYISVKEKWARER